MLGKVHPEGPGWEEVHADSKKPAPPPSDTYRKIERDQRRPPKAQEEQAGVEQKKGSVFELSREKPKAKEGKGKVSSGQGHVAPKGKGEVGGDKKTKGSSERFLGRTSRSSLKEEEVPEPSHHKLGEEPEFATAEKEAEPEFETETPPPPPTPEEIPVEVAEEAPETPEVPREAPEEAPETAEAPRETPEEVPAEAPKPFKAAPQEKPRMKMPGETVIPQQAQVIPVRPKEGKLETGETKKGEPALKKEKAKGEGKSATAETGGEKGVAPAVHSPIQAAGFFAEKAQETQQPPRSAMMRDLAAQIIDRIQVMRKEDQTSTIITLRHPPILSGATITLTAFDHAKREFNISFANLSPEAKHFLDRKLKEESLTDNLERKGIIVHNLTTTTQAETVITAEAGQGARDRQEQQQERQQQQQKRQPPAEEEETP